MFDTQQAAINPTVVRPGLLPVFKGTVALFAALVLVQAFLAGRGWFLDFDLIDIHGLVANAVFLVALLQAALAVAIVGRAGWRNPILLVSLTILPLVVVQIGLGFAGRDSANAAAWHIPNGVLIFGLATANSSMILRLGRG